MSETNIVIAIESDVVIAMIVMIYWLLKTPVVPDPRKRFLAEYQATAIKGWEKIHQHSSRKILESCQTNPKGCGTEDNCYTKIQFKDLIIKIIGNITVDQTLMILSEWEVSLSRWPLGYS